MIEKIAKETWKIGGGDWYQATSALSSRHDCNVYLIHSGGSLILVDGGTLEGKPFIEKNIREAGFQVEDITDILLTHSHYDHSESLWQWQSSCGATLHMSAIGAEYIRRGDHRLIGYLITKGPEYTFEPFTADCPIEDEETIHIGSLDIESRIMPGHTWDQMLYETEIENKKIWICGDITFGKDNRSGELGCVGRLKIWQSDLITYRNSLEKMLKLSQPDILLPGHGDPVFGSDNITEAIEASLFTVNTLLSDTNTRHFGVIDAADDV